MTITWTSPVPQQGWLCPQCHTVNAPWVTQCATAGCRPPTPFLTATTSPNRAAVSAPLSVTMADVSTTRSATQAPAEAPGAGGAVFGTPIHLATLDEGGGPVVLRCGAPLPATWSTRRATATCTQCHNVADQQEGDDDADQAQ